MGYVDYTAQEALNIQMGRTGSTLINSTTAYTGEWFKVICLSQTQFTTLTDSSRDGDAIGDITFAAGTILYGQFTAITLANGAVLACKA